VIQAHRNNITKGASVASIGDGSERRKR